MNIKKYEELMNSYLDFCKLKAPNDIYDECVNCKYYDEDDIYCEYCYDKFVLDNYVFIGSEIIKKGEININVKKR